MPLPYLDVPQFATVPDVPGVPNLLRAAGPLGIEAIGYLQADGILGGVEITHPTWGVFLNGGDALGADSIVGFAFQGDSRISDYPQEQGGFQSFNKVAVPAIVTLTVSKGGKLSDRNNFVSVLEALRVSTDVYTVTTPEWDYPSMNLTRVDYRRSADQGANIVIADLTFEEVRTTATAAFSSTAQPSGASNQTIGPVQPQPLTPAETAAITARPPA
jgi:hypothetical protein